MCICMQHEFYKFVNLKAWDCSTQVLQGRHLLMPQWICHYAYTRVEVIANNETFIEVAGNFIILFLGVRIISKQGGKYDFLVETLDIDMVDIKSFVQWLI